MSEKIHVDFITCFHQKTSLSKWILCMHIIMSDLSSLLERKSHTGGKDPILTTFFFIYVNGSWSTDLLRPKLQEIHLEPVLPTKLSLGDTTCTRHTKSSPTSFRTLQSWSSPPKRPPGLWLPSGLNGPSFPPPHCPAGPLT